MAPQRSKSVACSWSKIILVHTHTKIRLVLLLVNVAAATPPPTPATHPPMLVMGMEIALLSVVKSH